MMMQELTVVHCSSQQAAEFGVTDDQVQWLKDAMANEGPVLTKDDPSILASVRRMLQFATGAADAGHSAACLFCGSLGSSLVLQHLVDKKHHPLISNETQLIYLRKAATNGLLDAKVVLGTMLVDGVYEQIQQSPGPRELAALDEAIDVLKPVVATAIINFKAQQQNVANDTKDTVLTTAGEAEYIYDEIRQDESKVYLIAMACLKLANACLVHPQIADTTPGIREWARLMALASARGAVEAHMTLANVCRDSPFPQLAALRSDDALRIYLHRIRAFDPTLLSDDDRRFLAKTSGTPDKAPSTTSASKPSTPSSQRRSNKGSSTKKNKSKK